MPTMAFVLGRAFNETIKNNIVEHVFIGFRGDGQATGNLITNNWFDRIGNYDFGYAVSLRGNYTTHATTRTMTSVWTGVHLSNLALAGPANWNISHNDISAYAGGILYWLAYNASTGVTIDGNTVTAVPEWWRNNFGVMLNPYRMPSSRRSPTTLSQRRTTGLASSTYQRPILSRSRDQRGGQRQAGRRSVQQQPQLQPGWHNQLPGPADRSCLDGHSERDADFDRWSRVRSHCRRDRRHGHDSDHLGHALDHRHPRGPGRSAKSTRGTRWARWRSPVRLASMSS